MKMQTVRILNIIVFLITLIANFLANYLPMNNITTAQVSDQFNVYFVPANYVFAIWGVIYLGLFAFIIYQSLLNQQNNERLNRIGWWFSIGSIANAIWLILFHYGYHQLTLAAMLVLFISLLVIYQRVEIGKKPIKDIERWAVDLPFSIYLGWISVATIANVTQTLDFIKWNGFGITPEIWTVIVLLVAVGISWRMSVTRKDIAYNLVLVWAFIGISQKQIATPLVANGALAAAVLVLVGLVLGVLRKKKTSI